MQQLDALTLKHLARELDALLVGAKINKVQHLTPREFLLGFWSAKAGARNKLYINLQAALPCAFLVSSDEVRELVVPSLAKPTGFCMLLRKHLTHARLLEISTLPGERVLNLVLENFNELGNKVKLILSLELMGKHSNMLLVDDVQGTVLGAAHTVSENMSRLREVATGLPYLPPPAPQDKSLLFSASKAQIEAVLAKVPQTAEAMAAALFETFWGLGPAQLSEILSLGASREEFYPLLHRLYAGQQLKPSLREDYRRFTLLGGDEGWLSMPSVHELVSRYSRVNQIEARLKAFKQDLFQAIHRQKNRLESRLADQTPVAPEEIEHLRKQGDWLLTAVSTGELAGNPVAPLALVSDHETGAKVEIPVSPMLSWTRNAQRYYRQAKKEKARLALFEETSRRLRTQTAYLDELACMIGQAETLAQLDALHQDLIGAGLLKASGKPARKETGLSGLLNLISSDGLTIRVGKSGQANAELVGKLSRPEDLWLHVHEMPGSHVVVKSEKKEIPDATLLEAANLAVYYSAARHSRNVLVVYTPVRYVRKIPQSYPGHVTYREEKTVFITPDEALIQGLLASGSPS